MQCVRRQKAEIVNFEATNGHHPEQNSPKYIFYLPSEAVERHANSVQTDSLDDRFSRFKYISSSFYKGMDR